MRCRGLKRKRPTWPPVSARSRFCLCFFFMSAALPTENRRRNKTSHIPPMLLVGPHQDRARAVRQVNRTAGLPRAQVRSAPSRRSVCQPVAAGTGGLVKKSWTQTARNRQHDRLCRSSRRRPNARTVVRHAPARWMCPSGAPSTPYRRAVHTPGHCPLLSSSGPPRAVIPAVLRVSQSCRRQSCSGDIGLLVSQRDILVIWHRRKRRGRGQDTSPRPRSQGSLARCKSPSNGNNWTRRTRRISKWKADPMTPPCAHPPGGLGSAPMGGGERGGGQHRVRPQAATLAKPPAHGGRRDTVLSRSPRIYRGRRQPRHPVRRLVDIPRCVSDALACPPPGCSIHRESYTRLRAGQTSPCALPRSLHHPHPIHGAGLALPPCATGRGRAPAACPTLIPWPALLRSVAGIPDALCPGEPACPAPVSNSRHTDWAQE